MRKYEKKNLKLIGKNYEDLNVISAYLQDSVLTLKDILFLKKSRTFIMFVNRFMWEDVEKGVFRKNKRIRCAIRFDEVLNVKSKSINQKNKKKPYELLTIKSKLTLEDDYEIKICFAGIGIITVISEVIQVFMQDIGESWPAKYTPEHKI